MAIQEPVVNEIMRRYDILDSRPVTELQSHMLTSRTQFRAYLALIGYPFANPPSWMDQNYLKPVMDLDTFNSDLYDPLIHGLYSKMLEKITKDDDNE